MRLAAVGFVKSGFVLLVCASVVGCSAVSDFDYSFVHNAQLADGGTDGGGKVDIDGNIPIDSGFGGDARSGEGGTGGGGDSMVCSALDCCQISEVNEMTCDDGIDQDCDGKVDCKDSDCLQTAHCCPMPTFESGDKNCTDRIDNDCDGILDCAETSCAMVYKCTCKPNLNGGEDGKGFPARCINGEDDDCDQLIDCSDNDCFPASNCCTPTVGQSTQEVSCSDGVNNDCDVAGADCADPDCRMSTDAGSATANETGSACGDGKDNDCDGLVDCKDPDCANLLLCCIKMPLLASAETGYCSDGYNNDCDSQGADCFDSDCSLDPACCKAVSGGETTQELCSDREDNDCDGLIDCQDPNCNRTVHCCPSYLKANGQTLQTTETSCTDAYDNDCDGLLNCADPDCPAKGCYVIIRPPIIIDPTPPVETASFEN